jgi:hypothetical protein
MFSFEARFAGLADFFSVWNLNHSKSISMEATVKHLVSVYPYSRFVTLKQAFEDYHNSTGRSVQLAGVCIKPTRSSGNFTDNFEVVPIGWGTPVVDPLDSSIATPGPISFFNIVTYAESKFPVPVSSADEPSKKLLLDCVKMLNTNSDEVSALDKLRFYDKTAEFEYVFIDVQTLEYFAKDDSNGFYVVKNGQLYASMESTTHFQTSDRGLLLSRAFKIMKDDTSVDGTSVLSDVIYKRYRTLRFAPYPEPKMESTETRPSLAYYLGPACPPRWRNSGEEVFDAEDDTDGGSFRLASRSAVMATMPIQGNNTVEIEDCNCVVNKISMTQLHESLIDAGIIKEQFDKGDVYRFPRWPWIILGVVILALVSLGVVDLVQRFKVGN